MPRKPRYLSHNANNQTPDNKQLNTLHTPWFPFTYDSQNDANEGLCSTVPSGQSSHSGSASYDSLLQSSHLDNKRKVDAVLEHNAQGHTQSVRNVRSHVQPPDSCSVLPAHHLMPLKPQTASESNTCVGTFFTQSKNLPCKRKHLDLQASSTKNAEVADQHIRRALKSPRRSHAQDSYTMHAITSTHIGQQSPNTSKAASSHHSIDADSQLHQLHEAERPNSLRQQSCGSKRKTTGGVTHNVRRRLRTDNLANTSTTPAATSIQATGVMPPPDFTPSYEDLGDCDQRCHHCGAAFWYGERVKRSSTNTNTEYHLCCGDGKFIMDQERDPPEYIKQLLSDRNFMENIRAYNQMFAMTSFHSDKDFYA